MKRAIGWLLCWVLAAGSLLAQEVVVGRRRASGGGGSITVNTATMCAGNSGGTGSFTCAVTPTAGRTLVIAAGLEATSSTWASITPSAGSACTQDTAVQEPNSLDYSAFFRCPSVSSGITNIAFVTDANRKYAITILEVTLSGGVLAIDQTAVATKTSGTTWTTANLTASLSTPELVISLSNAYSLASGTMTATAPYTGTATGTGSTIWIGAYRVISASGTYTPNGNNPSGSNNATFGAIYKLQ